MDRRAASHFFALALFVVAGGCAKKPLVPRQPSSISAPGRRERAQQEERVAIVRGSFFNRRLGIRTTFPSNWVVLVGAKSGRVQVEGGRVKVLLQLVLDSTSEVTRDRVFEKIRSIYAGTTNPAGKAAVRETATACHSPFGDGWCRGWNVGGPPPSQFLRVVMSPVCRGRATIALVEIWENDEGREELDRWEASTVLNVSREPPGCEELAPDEPGLPS